MPDVPVMPDDLDVKVVAFCLRPPKGDVFTEEYAADLVGKTTTVNRLDRSEAVATVAAARMMSDGTMVLSLAVPGGIDRAPTPPAEEPA